MHVKGCVCVVYFRTESLFFSVIWLHTEVKVQDPCPKTSAFGCHVRTTTHSQDAIWQERTRELAIMQRTRIHTFRRNQNAQIEQICHVERETEGEEIAGYERARWGVLLRWLDFSVRCCLTRFGWHSLGRLFVVVVVVFFSLYRSMCPLKIAKNNNCEHFRKWVSKWCQQGQRAEHRR